MEKQPALLSRFLFCHDYDICRVSYEIFAESQHHRTQLGVCHQSSLRKSVLTDSFQSSSV